MKEHSLLEIATIKSGKRLPKGHELSNIPSPYPYIKARDIKKGKVNFVGLEFVDESTRKKIAKYIVSENDILITIVANIGDVGIVPKKLNNANLTENAVRLTNLKLFVNAQYLTYLLSQKEYKEYMESLAAGAAQAKLGIYKIEKIKVNLPEIAIQKRIASILSAYDDLIEVNNKRIELLEQSARELYKEWFVRMRFPNYQNTKFNKGIPEGWKIIRVDSLYETAAGGTPKSSQKEYYNGTIQFIKTGDLNDSFILDTPTKITKLGLDNSSAKIFPPYSVIFAMYGNTIGKMGILSKEAATNQACCVLISKKADYSWQYIFHSLLTFREQIINLGMGAAQQNISQEEIKKFKIYKPKKELIQNFNQKVSPIFTQIENLQKQNQELTAIRDRLLPRLISGKLEVKA